MKTTWIKSIELVLYRIEGTRFKKACNIKNITIGFNRLSLQDLTENANQPMKSLDGNGIIAFNGEIYNKIT